MQKIYEVQHIKQIVREVEETCSPITSPTDAVEMVQGIIGDVDREVLLVLVLNTKNRVVAIHQAHTGSLNSSIVHPREVFKAAILNNGASIIDHCQP
ncbi:JAB domain-containing protein [Shouchella sp. 1P09AA]|uniref:JAB domain-containing protein n=1 Tax=unclassified Shouchella TaxID=2893065 RepID=UPI0039A1CCC4